MSSMWHPGAKCSVAIVARYGEFKMFYEKIVECIEDESMRYILNRELYKGLNMALLETIDYPQWWEWELILSDKKN